MERSRKLHCGLLVDEVVARNWTHTVRQTINTANTERTAHGEVKHSSIEVVGFSPAGGCI